MKLNKNTWLWASLMLWFGLSFPMIKLAVHSFSPIMVVAIRLGIAAAILGVAMRVQGFRMRDIWEARAICLFVALIGNALPFYLIGFGEQHINASVAAVLMGIAPIATSVLAPFFIDTEHWSKRIFLGLAFGLVGILVLVGLGALRSIDLTQIAQLAVISAALCYATTTIMVRKYARAKPIVLATGAMGLGAIMAIMGCLVSGNVMTGAIDSSAVLGVLYLGVFPSALATWILFYLTPKLGAAKMGQINFGVPLVGASVGVLLLGEAFTFRLVIASAFILAALYLGLNTKNGHKIK